MPDRPSSRKPAIDRMVDDLRLQPLRPLVQHWLALYRASGTVPALQDLDALHFAPSMRHAWIIDAEADGGFRFRLSGEALSEWYGFSLKGKRYEEVFPAVTLPSVSASTHRVLNTPAGVYQSMTARMPDWTEPARYERMGLPLRNSSGSIVHMLGATLFEKPPAYNGKGSIDTALDTEYWYDIPDLAA
jgi:hypothetical protein